MTNATILPHNTGAAATWGAAGKEYERVSQTVADAIEHCVLRLEVAPRERILDVATGTGLAARRAAARGATVVGMDLGADLITAARAFAADERFAIDFRVGDAEQLPLEDGSFDAVLSTFGVMFVSRPEAAAAELTRVCRKGGRLGLVTWPPNGTVAGFFKMVQPYTPASPPPAPPSPFGWGSPNRVRDLLGRGFELRFETGTTVLREPSGESAWDLFVNGFGPIKTLAARLDPDRRAALRREFIAYHEQFRNDLGIAMPREYLVTIGVRR